MTKEGNELLKKAMELPVNERAALAGSLLDTLDETVDEDVEASWENEIALRIEELDSGKARPFPWTEDAQQDYGEAVPRWLNAMEFHRCSSLRSSKSAFDWVLDAKR